MILSICKSLSKITKAILNQHGIKLNKNLGQNYLIDKNKRDQIIDFGNIDKNDTILEIGTGIGTLTIELAKKAKKVIAIEQDKKIYEILAQRLKEEKLDNVELINDDALNVEFPKFNNVKSNATNMTMYSASIFDNEESIKSMDKILDLPYNVKVYDANKKTDVDDFLKKIDP